MAHPHAENMRLYAEDAAETDRPWERWEARNDSRTGSWFSCATHPNWEHWVVYRRKPRKVTITGPGGTFEYPEPMREAPTRMTRYWVPNLSYPNFPSPALWDDHRTDYRWLRAGLCHDTIESAQQHARALILAGGGSLDE